MVTVKTFPIEPAKSTKVALLCEVAIIAYIYLYCLSSANTAKCFRK